MAYFRHLQWVHNARSKECMAWVTQATLAVTKQGRYRRLRKACDSNYSQGYGVTSETG